jgi:hypothetical protein
MMMSSNGAVAFIGHIAVTGLLSVVGAPRLKAAAKPYLTFTTTGAHEHTHEIACRIESPLLTLTGVATRVDIGKPALNTGHSRTSLKDRARGSRLGIVAAGHHWTMPMPTSEVLVKQAAFAEGLLVAEVPFCTLRCPGVEVCLPKGRM